MDLQTRERRELAALSYPANVKLKVFLGAQASSCEGVGWRLPVRTDVLGDARRRDASACSASPAQTSNSSAGAKGSMAFPADFSIFRPSIVAWPVHEDFGMVGAIWQLLKDIGLNHIGG